jgi:hypothetical protein
MIATTLWEIPTPAERRLRAVCFGTPTNVGRSIKVEARVTDGPEKMLERNVTVTLTFEQIDRLDWLARVVKLQLQEQQRRTDVLNERNRAEAECEPTTTRWETSEPQPSPEEGVNE